jgi:hypothetical protein
MGLFKNSANQTNIIIVVEVKCLTVFLKKEITVAKRKVQAVNVPDLD